MRELWIPLQRDSRLRAAGELADWAHCVRRSAQPCLLVGADGGLIAIAAAARGLLGDVARPGLPESRWWHEIFPHSPAPARERSILARAVASATPTHSVIQLRVADCPVMMQVLISPLTDDGGGTSALLVFLQPVSNGLPPR